MQWQQLGRELGVQESVLEQIQHNHPNDPVEYSRLMVRGWLNSPHLRPCWYNLVQALCKLTMDHIVKTIQENHGNLSLAPKIPCFHSMFICVLLHFRCSCGAPKAAP